MLTLGEKSLAVPGTRTRVNITPGFFSQTLYQLSCSSPGPCRFISFLGKCTISSAQSLPWWWWWWWWWYPFIQHIILLDCARLRRFWFLLSLFKWELNGCQYVPYLIDKTCEGRFKMMCVCFVGFLSIGHFWHLHFSLRCRGPKWFH